ncbi:ABC transporter permease [Jiangella alkaliphila]|uniref:ABC-type nitrate/sulfonate/bicarbonate transport system, permease component n=1 Tax=Jiangella alkaliphila TaxID=419479 RepID=A0A1H2LDG4_9ACTN|nr:ABC transporter permease subunit [Jiangella alkaliphila]SDU79080.1 ABC-type nitrate/sulfonate/bicarbonate transport system, permease component [Jiangella alkaliphila]
MSALVIGGARRRGGELRPAGLARRLLAVAALLAAWAAASALVAGIATPWDTIAALAELATGTVLWGALAQTLWSTLLGLAIASAIAIPLGLLIGVSRFAFASSRILLDFLSAIPAVCFLPLGLLLFGPTLPMKLLLIGYGACWPLLNRTTDAVRDVDPLQRDVLDGFDVPRRVRWWRVYLPGSLPGILVGVRVALTIALLLSIASEYVGGAAGLGGELISAQQAGRVDDVMALAIATALLGVALNLAMRYAERALIGWHPSVRGRPA